jgi:hypothetical protein
MRILDGQDENLVAVVAGTAGTAFAQCLIDVVLAHAESRLLIEAGWRTWAIEPGMKAGFGRVRPTVLAVTAWPALGRGAGLGMASLCRRLAAALPADGLLILNGDDPRLAGAHWMTAADTWLVGHGAHCQLAAVGVHCEARGLAFRLEGQNYRVPAARLADLPGVLVAAAVGRRTGLSWEEIACVLREVGPPPWRSQAGRMQAIRRMGKGSGYGAVLGQVAPMMEKDGQGMPPQLARAA